MLFYELLGSFWWIDGSHYLCGWARAQVIMLSCWKTAHQNRKLMLAPHTKKIKEKQIKKRSTQSCEKDFKHDGLFLVINLSHLPNLECNSISPNIFANVVIFDSSWKKNKQKLYLFLDAVELQHLNDERSGASFVLDGPQQRPHVVHAEGLWPAPVPPALDADVEQLERRPERETQRQTGQRQKRQQTWEVRLLALYLSPSKRQ